MPLSPNVSGRQGPAFQDHRHDLWRGARHACKVDPCAAPNTPGQCVFQLEPDHLNFRPDGLEVVLDWDRSLDDGSADPQLFFYQVLAMISDPRAPNECDFQRGGYLRGDGPTSRPAVISDTGRFEITPVTASDGPACLPPLTDGP